MEIQIRDSVKHIGKIKKEELGELNNERNL